MRLLLAVLLVGAVTAPASAGATSDRDIRRALAVLHMWDARRATAWARADPAALRRLYVPGSTAAEADVRLLDRWTARGFVVRRLRTQVFSASVLRSSATNLRLRLLDRVAGGEVYVGAGKARLPASPPAVRVVELRRGDGRWRMASVRTLSGSGPSPPRAPSAHRGR